MASSPPPVADADFIATCYEVLLGRELDSLDVVRDRAGWPRAEVVRSIVGSAEFTEAILPCLETGLPFRSGRFAGRPSLRQRLWAAEALGLGSAASEAVEGAQDWRDLLAALSGDVRFTQAVNWPRPW